jgi:hypothetical protein
VKEDLEYYVESHGEDEFMMAYDEDGFYDELGLDDLDVVNVDRVTQASVSSKKKDDDASSATSGSKKEKNSKKSSAASGMIPLTIGRAKVSKKSSIHQMRLPHRKLDVQAQPFLLLVQHQLLRHQHPKLRQHLLGGASMAAVLKRERK